MKKLFSAFVLLFCVASSAQAATFLSASGSPDNIVTDYSDTGLISFDLDMANFIPTILNYEITAADIGSPLISNSINFNALVRNLTGAGLEYLTISLNASSFDSIGTVTRQFGGSFTVNQSNNGQNALITFSSPEFLDFFIGAPLAGAGEVDWAIKTTGLNAGDQLAITIAVPEPETYAMLIMGLALIGGAVRLRK